MQDVLQDVFHDALPMIPFLFLTYLLMEYLEHKSNDRFQKRLESARALGPLIGGILGIGAAMRLFCAGKRFVYEPFHFTWNLTGCFYFYQ